MLFGLYIVIMEKMFSSQCIYQPYYHFFMIAINIHEANTISQLEYHCIIVLCTWYGGTVVDCCIHPASADFPQVRIMPAPQVLLLQQAVSIPRARRRSWRWTRALSWSHRQTKASSQPAWPGGNERKRRRKEEEREGEKKEEGKLQVAVFLLPLALKLQRKQVVTVAIDPFTPTCVLLE